MLEINLYPAKPETARWIERKKGVIILNPSTGVYHKLNPTATYIWQVCNGIKSIKDICRLIIKKYNVSLAKAKKDVSYVIGYLLKAGLIKLHKSSKRFYPS